VTVKWGHAQVNHGIVMIDISLQRDDCNTLHLRDDGSPVCDWTQEACDLGCEPLTRIQYVDTTARECN